MPRGAPVGVERLPAGAAYTDQEVRADSRQITKNWYFKGMGMNTSISLDDHFASFLSEQVGTGRYRSASEVVRAGLRLLEEQETQLSVLRASLVAGETSGEAQPFDFDSFIAAKKA